jgi:hypothetical protein
VAAKTSTLLIAQQAEAALTPEQRKYNQLVGRIEKARTVLLAWQEQVPLFAQAHATRLQPLMAELAQLQLQLVRKLAGLLAGSGCTKPERRTLRRALCDLAADLVAGECVDEATAAELEALHDQHAENSLEDERRAAVADMKDMLQAMSGLDLGDEDFESEEALLLRARERMHDAARQHQEAAPPRRPPRQTAAQRRRQAQEQEASKSVREVFRKLASALHPDRSGDEADHARRTALMQRVNQAYAKQDLLGLFALQLEIEQVDPEHLARASSERMRHYNRVLAAQLKELQDEIDSRASDFAMQFGIEPWRGVNPHKLAPLLDEDLRQMRARLVQARRDLQMLERPDSLKRWIKQMRLLQKLDDSDPFGLPF